MLQPRRYSRGFICYQAIVVTWIGRWIDNPSVVTIPESVVSNGSWIEISPEPDYWKYRVKTYFDGDLVVTEEEIAGSMDRPAGVESVTNATPK